MTVSTDLQRRPGVIGLGTIGAGISRSMARNGLRPVVTDVSREAVHALSAIADAAASPTDVARGSDVVHI